MFKQLSDVKAANIAAGYHWFDPDTMEFWKTKIESGLLKHQYFITSEDEFVIGGRKPARVYAVRQAQEDGSIRTVISLLPSKEEAKEYVKAI